MKKWSEKTTLEKISGIIAEVTFCAWLILEAIGRNGGAEWTDIASRIAIMVICVFEGISFWNYKRFVSYIAIGGFVCILATFVLEFMPLAK